MSASLAWLAVSSGLAIVLTVLADVFRSVLLPRATTRRWRLAPLLARAMLPAWRRLAARARSARERQAVRGALAPMLLVAMMSAWVGLMTLGFGLMLLGLSDRFAPPLDGVLDAVYRAGEALLTLGLSGTEAHGAARLVVLAAGLAGLATVTVVATFLLQVQGALERRETLVLRLVSRAGRPPSGARLLATHARLGHVDALADLFDAWEGWAAMVSHTHRAYPILLWFRSADEDAEWLAALLAVLDAAALLLTLDDDPRAARAHAEARLLLDTAGPLPGQLARMLELRVDAAPDPSAARHEAELAHLRDAGWRTGSGAATGVERLAEQRSRYLGAIVALAARLDVRLDASATHPVEGAPARPPKSVPDGAHGENSAHGATQPPSATARRASTPHG